MRPVTSLRGGANCDASYPDVCIAPSPPDLDCDEVPHTNIRVLPPDPHRFDGRDDDGIGCES
jgi:micrococcal nuclease